MNLEYFFIGIKSAYEKASIKSINIKLIYCDFSYIVTKMCLNIREENKTRMNFVILVVKLRSYLVDALVLKSEERRGSLR